MSSTPVKSKPSELEQAAADRRSFGNAELAANAEFKVIAEAMRELVTELRLIRLQVDKLVMAASHGQALAAPRAATAPGAAPARVD